MDKGIGSVVRRAAAGLSIAIIVAGCGGGGGRSTSVDPNIPVIANLALSLLAQACTVGGGTGRVLSASFSYVDADGNLRGGVVQTTGTFEPSGGSTDVNYAIPGEVTITGTTSGDITVLACVRFGAQSALRFAVAVVDASQHSSNVISSRLDRPAGAPETPTGGAAGKFGPAF